MGLMSKVAKLRTMDAAEVGSRAIDWVFEHYERRLVPPRSVHEELAAANGRTRPDGAARETPAPPLFQSLQDADILVEILRTDYGEQSAASHRRADAALAHRFELFGRSYDLGSAIDWHVDPPTGLRWPRLFHADALAAAPDGADVKHVWELNRHQFLIDLGKAWLLTNRREYLDEIVRVVHTWCEQNPTGLGINWAGALEPSYRAVSWLWAYHMVRPALAPVDVHLWDLAMREHGRFLYRHLELFSSPYNHLVGEAAALYMLGVMCPAWPESRRWRRRGRHVLESRLRDQFHGDGGSVEQAVVYHHATLGFYLLAALLGRQHGEEFSPEVWAALERGIEFSMHLAQPDGAQPAIGDNDDARPIRFEHLDTWDYRHFQSAGAVLFGRPDFKCAAGRLHEDVVWLLGPEAIARYREIDAVEPAARGRVFQQSGYAVLRSGWNRGADYVCFDAGEQAGGLRTDSVPSAGHGHADCLAVLACLDGRPVLVDAGFYTYNGDVRWERWFRETAAHNTIRIDRREQAVHLDKMAWAEVPRAVLEGWDLAGDGLQWARGTHDGYCRTRDGVRHTRTVLLEPGVGVLVYDELSAAAGEHEFELGFLFAPELLVTLAGAFADVGGQFTLGFTGTVPLGGALLVGADSPTQGWVAPRLDVRVPAHHLAISGRSDGRETSILTVLARRNVWDAGSLVRTEEWPAVLRPGADSLHDSLVAHYADRGRRAEALLPQGRVKSP
jgi:Heparinase II/III-like protein/Heparinase II/III N-terminus